VGRGLPVRLRKPRTPLGELAPECVADGTRRESPNNRQNNVAERAGKHPANGSRFTDVTPERVEALLSRVEESDGPPEGVPSTGVKMLHDEAQGTAVVLQYFETAEDMKTGAEVFSAMDPGETPGTRASVDMCELKMERQVQ